MTYELGIIGAGNMAEAIARGVIRTQTIAPARIIVSDVSPERRDMFQSQLQVAATEDNQIAARQSSLLLLSVKPQQMKAALASIAPVISPDTLIVSIAAGISASFIENSLGTVQSWHVVRAMPNTPMLVGEGMAAICAGAHATPADLAKARRIFESSAAVIEVAEDKMDAVTALSGSGPAYFFFLVEQLVKSGIELGLTQKEARLLAVKTAVGAAKMLMESDQEPAELRRKVTSPGGTTQAAIQHMERANWPAITVDAIKAAARRGGELRL